MEADNKETGPLRYIYLEEKSYLSLLWSFVEDHKIALLWTLRTPFKLFSQMFSDEPVRQILWVEYIVKMSWLLKHTLIIIGSLRLYFLIFNGWIYKYFLSFHNILCDKTTTLNLYSITRFCGPLQRCISMKSADFYPLVIPF